MVFWLGPYEYSSKQVLLDRVKHFLQRTPPGPVTHEIAIHKLRLLVALHPDAERKVGAGIESFKIVRNEGSGQGIHFVRVDGTEDTFSYHKCIMGIPQSPYGKVCEALRFAVRPQLSAFRANLTLPIPCAISGVTIKVHRELHIDHKEPFWKLLRAFSKKYSIDLQALETTGSGESLRLNDEKISSMFEQYHLEHAQLQASFKAANAAKGGRLGFKIKVDNDVVA